MSLSSAPENSHTSSSLLVPITQFLKCATPHDWLAVASQPENLPTLLVDHCNCEFKAAQTGLQLMRKYALSASDSGKVSDWTKPYEAFVYFLAGGGDFPDRKTVLSVSLTAREDCDFAADMLRKMVALIKEELLHFEQVLAILRQLNIEYVRLSASRYASSLVKHVRTYEPAALVDKLIIGALIEARSCERFSLLAPILPERISGFYQRLLKSEARHFQDYLSLADQVAKLDKKVERQFLQRIDFLAECEAELICSTDSEFRFHSGVPQKLCT